MDYLRSAASAVLAKSTGPFPNYTIGAAVPPHPSSSQTIWSLHSGTKRDDGSPVSILIFDCANNPNARSQLALAKNALRKLRTLRHPDVLKLLDSAETPTAVYIAVEPVRPLGPVLSDWVRNGGTEEGKHEWIAWGLSRIAVSCLVAADDSHCHALVLTATRLFPSLPTRMLSNSSTSTPHRYTATSGQSPCSSPRAANGG